MATITSLLLPATGNSNRGRMPYQVELIIDLTAQAIDCSAPDTVQCITLPANTHILHAGVQVVESATMNTGTNATITLGAADVDEYVTAFDITALTDTALTVTAPSAGNCQLMSLTHFIDSMADTSVTVTVPLNALSNGAGGNNTLATRVPPQVRAHDLASTNATNIGNTTVQFSTAGNHNIYSVVGGLDTFDNIIYNLQF